MASDYSQTEHESGDIIAPLVRSLPAIECFSQALTDLIGALTSHLNE